MPRRVLHLLPDLHHSADATRVRLLCQHLPRERIDQHIAALRPHGAARDALASTGAPLHGLSQRFAWDPFLFRRLRALLEELQPDAVSVWGEAPRRYANLAVSKELLVRPIDPPDGVPSLPEERVDRDKLGLPSGARLVGVVSRLVPARRVKELVWAFDLVRVLHDDARLVVVGDGPERLALERFAQLACQGDRIHFLGARDDVASLLPHFELLLAGDAAGHKLAILEAMSAGLPIVCEPGSVAFVDESCCLPAAAGDRAAVGKAVCRLLDDQACCERMGLASRRLAEERHALAPMLEAYSKAFFGVQAAAGGEGPGRPGIDEAPFGSDTEP